MNIEEQIKEIRVILMNCFDNERYAWREAHERLSDLLTKSNEEAEYNALINFRDFVKNGLDHNRINYDDFRGEFELFMARNYADRRFADVVDTIRGVAKILTQQSLNGR